MIKKTLFTVIVLTLLGLTACSQDEAEKAAENVKESFHDAVTATKEAAHDAGNTIKEAGHDAAEATKEMAHDAKKAVE